MAKTIFFVEDDLSFGSVMKSYLEINDFEVTWVNDGSVAIEKYKQGKYDLAVLDVMLPHVDGFTIGKAIKEITPVLPLIYLTAKSLKDDILIGYGIGADDYVTKPFDTEVLLCKLKAILKRGQGEVQKRNEEIYQIGRCTFNFRYRFIEVDDNKQKLSPKEAGLLRLLCLKKNELLPREEALQKLWGEDDYFTGRSMDVYIAKLRKYLKLDASVQIENIHGSGFILVVE